MSTLPIMFFAAVYQGGTRSLRRSTSIGSQNSWPLSMAAMALGCFIFELALSYPLLNGEGVRVRAIPHRDTGRWNFFARDALSGYTET